MDVERTNATYFPCFLLSWSGFQLVCVFMHRTRWPFTVRGFALKLREVCLASSKMFLE